MIDTAEHLDLAQWRRALTPPVAAASVRAARRRPGFVQGDSRLTRLLMPWIPAPWVKWFTPGLLFLAEKPKT